jgi:hypothetical protein
MKLRELVEQVDNTKYKLEIYKEIYIFLQEFTSTDSREAKKVIALEGSDSKFVPISIIEEVIEDIESTIKALETSIEELEEKEI